MEFNRGDIILVDNKNATGNIQTGERPYLIVSNNKNNAFSNILTVIPSTTKEKNTLPTHYTMIRSNGIKNTFLAEQITCISKNEVIKVIDKLNEKDIREIEKTIRVQLGLSKIESKPKIAGTEFDRRFALTPQGREDVWNDYLSGMRSIDIARKHKVSRTLVYNIIKKYNN